MIDGPARRARREAALRLLRWHDTAVIEDAATTLTFDGTSSSMEILCVALAEKEAQGDYEGQETILWVLSPAMHSGEVDVVGLLSAVRESGEGRSAQGARIALDWPIP